MFKNFNNILLKRKIVLLLRIVLMMILINYLLSTAVQKQDAVIFFKRELISIFSYNDYSEANLEIPKLLLNLSLFMVGWLSVILLESDLADHYHHLIRYQSSSFLLYFLAFVGQEWMMDHIVTVYLLLLSLLVMLILSRLEEKFKKG
ncbi:TPA: hypothetical protein ACL199_000100 [Streptococcus pneumoniae]|nr:Uncharacterised protein [Streptococcus pneumoniae]VMK97499.1 Uncharacterised protein [Streptococcus pneumoniae]VTB13650.1 Uncharacterised protein [Streptococcus pneumoniae]HEV1327804.1 hypothetical protein [Streptococcus pneumoniae]HEV1341653.1 hypothetical protein [Streptococcus pneumoniae]